MFNKIIKSYKIWKKEIVEMLNILRCLLYSIKSNNAFKYSFYYLHDIFNNLNLKKYFFREFSKNARYIY